MLNIQNFSLLWTVLFLLWNPATGCTEDKCGRVHIQFPFHLKNSKLLNPTTDYYPPGFDLLCNDAHETVLELPSVPIKLFVRKIDYESQLIHVYDPQNCLPRQLMKLGNSSISPFNFQLYEAANVSFFSCNSMSCPIVQVGSYNDFIDPKILSCTKVSDVFSVQWQVEDDLPNNVVMEWSNPDCSSCVAQGHKCKYKNGTQSETECVFCPKNGISTSKIVLIAADKKVKAETCKGLLKMRRML